MIKNHKPFRKAITITLSVIAILSLYELGRRNIGGFAGSYPFAETWTIHHPLEDVKLRLAKLHRISPNLFRDTASLQFTNAYSSDPSSQDRIDFYYADRDEYVQVIITSSWECDTCAEVALVSFISRKNSTIRLMNRDFNWFANRREIQTFEDRILRHISED